MDCNLDDDLVPAAAEMKLERIATYRQLQGYSAQLHRTSGGALCIDDFKIPEGAVVRPTTLNERREGNTLVDNDSGERKEVLPSAITRCMLLILMLDMGSIGTAGVAHGAFKLHRTILGQMGQNPSTHKRLQAGRNTLHAGHFYEDQALVGVFVWVEQSTFWVGS